VLQDLVSVFDPGHGAPPFSGGVQVAAVLDSSPPPQLSEQLVQADQDDQYPSTGQGCVLQDLVCVFDPGHGAPPFCGGLQVPVLASSPPPQVTEQLLQADQDDQYPSIGPLAR